MSNQFIVSILGNLIKQRARFKILVLANMRMSGMTSGYESGNVNDVSNNKHYHNVKTLHSVHGNNNMVLDVLTSTNFKPDSLRSYSSNSSDIGHESGYVYGNERLSFNQGPVRMTLNEEGKLEVHIDDCATVNNIEKIGIESKILTLFEENQTERAIELLESTLASGNYPNDHSVILLCRKLGQDGAVESLLRLQHLIIDKKLCRETYYLKSLVSAFDASGRTKDAVEYLKKLLLKDHDNYLEVQNFFIFLTTLILKKSPHHQKEIVSMVNECKFREIENDLWNCYILTGNFQEAEKLLAQSENLKKITELIFELNAIIRYFNEYCDDKAIWRYFLISGEDLGLKRRMLLWIYEEYLISISKKQQFREVILNLNKASRNQIKISKDRFIYLKDLIIKSEVAQEEMELFRETYDWYKKIYGLSAIHHSTLIS